MIPWCPVFYPTFISNSTLLQPSSSFLSNPHTLYLTSTPISTLNPPPLHPLSLCQGFKPSLTIQQQFELVLHCMEAVYRELLQIPKTTEVLSELPAHQFHSHTTTSLGSQVSPLLLPKSTAGPQDYEGTLVMRFISLHFQISIRHT